jgi:acetyl esterase/lipase
MNHTTAISDWNDAYANRAHVPDADKYIDGWPDLASAYRASADCQLDLAYDAAVGSPDRHRFDLFLPATSAQGLFVFIHGGYWMMFDKSSWSHFAAGAVDNGWAVAIPSYTLAPEVSVAEIKHEVAAAVSAAAALVAGPIVLSGHSAGGQLVSRLTCQDSPLGTEVSDRVRDVISISGVHDLRPLLQTELNDTLKFDANLALGESPALLPPIRATKLTCLVGGAERPEFIRQSALLANVWVGMGCETQLDVRDGMHHFNIIEPLKDPSDPLFERINT